MIQKQVLTGTLVATALQRTDKPIELRDGGGSRIATLVTWKDLEPYMVQGYDFIGTKHRVYSACPPRPRSVEVVDDVDRRVFESDPSFWEGRGCMRFWKDQVTPGYSARVDSFACVRATHGTACGSLR